MWVKGNLKDHLGITRRRDQMVLVGGSSSDLEGTPMFRERHTRSASEMSTTDIYEPNLPRAPGDFPSTGAEKDHGTPPQIGTASVASGSSQRPLTPIATVSNDEDVMPSAASPSGAEARAVAMSPSPQPSYYSASDIPLPSPLPSPGFYNPSPTYPRAASLSYSRPLRSQYLSPHPDNLAILPNSYEMRVHDLTLGENSAERRELSAIGEEASYTLAVEREHGQHGHSRSPSPPGWRASTLSTADDGPIAL
jgi:phospholipid-translocating ATPase